MRSFWNGTISFGLVNIPVSVIPASKSGDLSFHFLHKTDLGRIHNERICDECGKVVPYNDVVRGYEYDDDKYVPLTKEDFEDVYPESSKNIEILDFVNEGEINPMFFDKPYYLTPDKKGEKAYNLFREALKRTKKVGIGKVIFHTREHLGAIRSQGSALVLEVMHFASDLKQPEEIGIPKEEKVAKKELDMAEQLIDTMAVRFNPSRYHDTYQENLEKLVNAKVRGKPTRSKSKRKAAPTNVIDIMSKLKASLRQKKSHGKRASSV